MGTIGSVVANYYGRAGYLFEQKGNWCVHCSFTILLTSLFALAFSSGVIESNLLVAATPVPTQPAPSFWAQLINISEDATLPSKAVAFRVTPAIPDMDGLKKAVKAEMPNALKDVDAVMLKVYAHDATTGKWVEVPKASASLEPNTEETAYHVLVP